MRQTAILSGRVANANTTGFKSDQVLLEQHKTRDVHQKIIYPNDHATVVDLKQGGLKPTYRSLDLAIKGPGFFAVNTPQGIRYTRDGSFHLNGGLLTDLAGNNVLSGDGQEIAVGELQGEPFINELGVIFVGEDEVGAVGVFDFEDPNSVRKAGDSQFMSTQEAIPAESTQVIQGYLEDSNVNTIKEMADLIKLERQVSMDANLIGSLYSMERQAITTLAK
jgi:flagellar basal body rod protein FlgG